MAYETLRAAAIKPGEIIFTEVKPYGSKYCICLQQCLKTGKSSFALINTSKEAKAFYRTDYVIRSDALPMRQSKTGYSAFCFSKLVKLSGDIKGTNCGSVGKDVAQGLAAAWKTMAAQHKGRPLPLSPWLVYHQLLAIS